MNSQREKLHCDICGKSLEDISPYVTNDNAFCCEGCYLTSLANEGSQYELDQAHLALAESLVAALDAREHETGIHSRRVACHTHLLACRFSSEQEYLQQIYWGALLHDIGKIAIPDEILLKQGPLTETEWEVMRSHPQRGYEIISTVPFMHEAAQIILCHEEHYDGGGYPLGLKGDSIPWGARLFSVIDTLDAMTNSRSYREALDFDVAKQEILKQSGQQFDPQAVEAFLAEEQRLREMVDMKCIIRPDL